MIGHPLLMFTDDGSIPPPPVVVQPQFIPQLATITDKRKKAAPVKQGPGRRYRTRDELLAERRALGIIPDEVVQAVEQVAEESAPTPAEPSKPIDQKAMASRLRGLLDDAQIQYHRRYADYLALEVARAREEMAAREQAMRSELLGRHAALLRDDDEIILSMLLH